MKAIPILIAITALPLMALGQTTDQQSDATKAQTEAKEKALAKKKKVPPADERGEVHPKAEAGANLRAPTKAKTVKTETGVRSSKTVTKVNVQEFKSQHREVFALGRHPKEFFVQRFGANHFRLIGNTYFAFVDGCWVAVDVDGFGFAERVICEGDPDYIVVD